MNRDENRKFFWLGCAVLLLICFGVFGRSLGYGFVDYDDPAYVTENGYVNEGLSVTGVKWAMTYESGGRVLKHIGAENVWHPLTWISHMADVSVFGVEDGEWGHHLTNVLLHGVSACLVCFFFGRLMRNGWVGFLAALFFLVHPLKVESVAWISERKDVLSGVFFWGALCGVVASFGGRMLWRWVGLGCFGLALMSKPSVVILPGLVVLADGLWRGEKSWDLDFFVEGVKRWWLWFALSGATAAVAVYFQAQGSHADFMEGSLGGRLASMMPGLAFYGWRALVPWDLNLHYPMPNFGGLKGLLVVAGCLLAVGTVAVILWMKRREWPVAFFAAGWFLLCWLPMSGLVYVGTSFTADRYMYLALSGPLLWLAALLVKVNWGKWLAVLLVLVWSGLSFVQTGVWRDSLSLFGHGVKAQPKDALSWANLGSVYQVGGDYQKGIECHGRAVALKPMEYISWYNLGYCWGMLGDKEKAKSNYERSLAAYPNFVPSLKNLGAMLEDDGDKSGARDLYWRAAQANRFRDEAILNRLVQVEGDLRNFAGIRKLLSAMEASGNRYSPEFEAGVVRLRSQLRRFKPEE